MSAGFLGNIYVSGSCIIHCSHRLLLGNELSRQSLGFVFFFLCFLMVTLKFYDGVVEITAF